MKFAELGLKSEVKRGIVKINDTDVKVLKYLPVADKTKLISFVVDLALDDNTGCFSPLRVEVYFAIAVCKWYAGIEFSDEELTHIDTVYDLLESNYVIDKILGAIPEDELKFIQELVLDTVADISRYNSSAAGIIRAASIDTNGLDKQITEILEKVKKGEGLETLGAIKKVVGTD